MAKYSYHRLDANHREIKAALEAVGATVDEKGPLDLLVGFRSANYLLEVKTARGKLRTSQKSFLAGWKGQASVVKTVDEALRAIGMTEPRPEMACVRYTFCGCGALAKDHDHCQCGASKAAHAIQKSGDRP